MSFVIFSDIYPNCILPSVLTPFYCMHCRIRLGLSVLNGNLLKYNIVEDKIYKYCYYCNENSVHYPLDYPTFAPVQEVTR